MRRDVRLPGVQVGRGRGGNLIAVPRGQDAVKLAALADHASVRRLQHERDAYRAAAVLQGSVLAYMIASGADEQV